MGSYGGGVSHERGTPVRDSRPLGGYLRYPRTHPLQTIIPSPSPSPSQSLVAAPRDDSRLHAHPRDHRVTASRPEALLGHAMSAPSAGSRMNCIPASDCRSCACAYRGYSKLRTRTALGPYGRSMPRSIGPPQGRCVSLISSNPCTLECLQRYLAHKKTPTPLGPPNDPTHRPRVGS